MRDCATLDIDDVLGQAEFPGATASGMAAKASLISMRSTSLSFPSSTL